MTRAEWHSREHFAEIAETLGVNTDGILAAWGDDDGSYGVLYGPYPSEPTRIFQAELHRDPDGLLYRVAAPLEVPGLWEHIVKRIGENL